MIISLIITIAIVFGLPLIAVLFTSHAGMAICLISYFLVNPVVSVSMGVFAGLNAKKRWYACLYTGVIFILSVCLLFRINDLIFLVYAANYIVFSFLSMLVTSLIAKRKK